MKKSSSRRWWSSRGAGEPAHAPDTDYADMGTAFGLDASLAPPAGESSEATADHGDADEADADADQHPSRD